MRVLFVTSGYLPMPPVNGGACENLLMSFLVKNEEKKWFDVVVGSVHSDKAEIAAQSIKHSKFLYVDTTSILFRVKQVLLFIINRYGPRYIGNAFVRSLAAVIKKEEDPFDLIVVENRPEFIFALKGVVGKKIILHLHNDYLSSEIKGSKEIVDSYNVVFAVSAYIQRRLSSTGSDTPISILNNGINLSKFDRRRRLEKAVELRIKYKISETDFVILYTGRLTSSKGVHFLLKAFVALPDTFKVKLLIVGSAAFGHTVHDEFLLQLKDIAKKRPDDIVFTGYTPYEIIPDIYSLANIGVVPSIAPEAFPLTVLEHLAAGNPVVTTAVGGIADMINDTCAIIVKNDESIIVDQIYDAISLLYSNKDRCREMSDSAIATSLKYNEDEFCDNFMRLLYQTYRVK